MYSIALDLHQASVFMVAVNDKRERVASRECPTSADNLIALVQSVGRPRQVIVEECHLAQWAKDVLESRGEKVIVCDPRQNHWIAKADYVDDRIAANKLADLAAMGCLKEIHHPDPEGAALRSLMRTYYEAGHDLTRQKNRIKATFRSIAIGTNGSKVYQPKGRSAWLKRLADRPDLALRARGIYRMHDVAEAFKLDAFGSLHACASKLPIYEKLIRIPGAGRLIACGYIALIGDAARFPDERRLWAYAGFGNILHESGGKRYKKGCSRSGNRILKWLVLQHFMAATRCTRPNRFKRKYNQLTAAGMNPKDARRTVCRAILSVVRAIWISNKEYDDNHVSKPR